MSVGQSALAPPRIAVGLVECLQPSLAGSTMIGGRRRFPLAPRARAGATVSMPLRPDLVQDWVTKDGHERVDVLPKGNSNNDETLRNFARAVLAVEPRATGRAVEIQNWAETMIRALIEAAAIAFCAIAILLWILLRRLGDVLLTLVPLLVAALATLEICALTGFQLNYANIIAFPVLLGIGVAFKIYYIMAWRGWSEGFPPVGTDPRSLL